uniref:hypothetical protein n=1 Tax=Pseudomonas aeruginosa TaxID=287 RepID=UPI001C4A340C
MISTIKASLLSEASATSGASGLILLSTLRSTACSKAAWSSGKALDADSTPFGHSAHADPDTCS